MNKKREMNKFVILSLLLSALYFFTGCAPKVAPPPQYMEEDLSLEDVIKKAGSDIEALKGIAEIRIEKNNEPYDFISASVIIKRPEQVHMRIYKFGMLVKDFVVRDGELYVISGKGDEKLKNIAEEFLCSIFWWDNLKDASMHRAGEEYVIKTLDREIHLDVATLLPLRQEIRTLKRIIYITYSEPRNNEGFWYPSRLEITADGFRFIVTLDKLIKNPRLGAHDFKISGS
ncbi:MAG: hypothetical protein C4560_10360 [Nitrospiraceae bacterium]|nr:MAG: hypothetical protein C4560_10360 [Nitrospiraceae bacterium]